MAMFNKNKFVTMFDNTTHTHTSKLIYTKTIVKFKYFKESVNV